jgi:ribosomal protein L11 methyltransferase
MSDYVEVRVQTAADSGELTALLEDQGVLGSWEGDGVVFLYWRKENWTPGALTELRRVLELLGVPEAATSVTALADRNWNSHWVETIQPVCIGRRIRIRQSWNDADPLFNGIQLVVDPEQAFGSGYHETTQLLMEWLELGIRGGESVLDVGTGSGILAMIALRAGAASALGIDNDPVAIDCALKNARANGFGPELEFKTATPEELGNAEFEIIAANLDRRTVLATAPAFPRLAKPGAKILLSGLLVEDCVDIAAAFELHGCDRVEQRAKGEWAALVLQYNPTK